METKTTIAQRLRAVRGALTQAEFAHRLGVHKNTLGRYERGESEPDTRIARHLCTIFGVQPHWLLFGDGEQPSENGTAATPCSARFPSAKSARIDEWDDLRRDNRELRQELREMRFENRELRQENKALDVNLRELMKENGELRAKLAEYRTRRSPDGSPPGPESLHSA